MINRADSRLHPHIFAVATPFLFFPFVFLNKDPCALRDRCPCAVSSFLKHSSLKPLHWCFWIWNGWNTGKKNVYTFLILGWEKMERWHPPCMNAIQGVCVSVFVCHFRLASARTLIPHLTPGSTCMCASVCVPFFLCKCHGAWTSTPLVQRVSVCVLVFVCNSCLTHAKDREHPTPPDPTPPTPPLVCVLVFACHFWFARAMEH